MVTLYTVRPYGHTVEVVPTVQPHGRTVEVVPTVQPHGRTVEVVPTVRPYGHTVDVVPTVRPYGVVSVYHKPHKMAPWVISYFKYIFTFSNNFVLKIKVTFSTQQLEKT